MKLQNLELQSACTAMQRGFLSRHSRINIRTQFQTGLKGQRIGLFIRLDKMRYIVHTRKRNVNDFYRPMIMIIPKSHSL